MTSDTTSVDLDANASELKVLPKKMTAGGSYEHAEYLQIECRLHELRHQKKNTDVRISLALITGELDIAFTSAKRSALSFSELSIGEAAVCAVAYAQKFIKWYSSAFTFASSEQLGKAMEHILALLQLAKELLLTCPEGTIPIQTAALINLQSRMVNIQTQTANVHHR